MDVLTCGEIGRTVLEELLRRYGLELRWIADGGEIPGSYWGAPEAGILRREVFVRSDTPVHSLLHESCHTICMDEGRRAQLVKDAGGEDAEENAVCYLQIVLADEIPGVGAARLMDDMDRWGYSFRLGSTRAWFEGDAEDAREWLVREGLLGEEGHPVFRLR